MFIGADGTAPRKAEEATPVHVHRPHISAVAVTSEAAADQVDSDCAHAPAASASSRGADRRRDAWLLLLSCGIFVLLLAVMHLHALHSSDGVGMVRRIRSRSAAAVVHSSSPLDRRLLSSSASASAPEGAASAPGAAAATVTPRTVDPGAIRGVPAGYYDARPPAVRARARNPWSPFRSAQDKVRRFDAWETAFQALLDRDKDPRIALHKWIGRAVDHLPVRAAAPHQTNRTVTLLEGRADPIFIFLLRHLFHMLGPGWALHVFHTSANEQWWVEQLDVRAGGSGEHVQLQRVEPILFQQANSLATSRAFLERIHPHCETILLVQSDTMMVRSDWLAGVAAGTAGAGGGGPGLDWLLSTHAYLGAPWVWCEEEWCRPGGNGGMSMRKRSVMFDLVSEYRCSGSGSGSCALVSSFAEAGRQSDAMKHVEDTFLSHQLYDRRYKYAQGRSQLASQETNAWFALESLDFPHVHPFFVHKIWRYMTRQRFGPMVSQIMQYYPELWMDQQELDRFREECREGI